MFNELQLNEGLYPPNDKHADEFYAIEREAKNDNLGIWSIPGFVTDVGFKSDDGK